MKKKIGFIYSSFNNYDLLENEVLKRVDFEGYPVINIDDKSSIKNAELGAKLCEKNKIYFQKNKKKGLQFAVSQGIDFLKKEYDVEWVFCLQQDIYPVGKNFFSNFEKMVNELKNNSVGAIGFNIISKDGVYMNPKIISDYYKGKKPFGWMGLFPLSGVPKFSNLKIINGLKYIFYSIFKNPKNLSKKNNLLLESRVFCEYSTKNFNKISKLYSGLSAIDLPMWGAIAINVDNWYKFIQPREGYKFHLWFPDIGFQFLKNNIWLATHSEFYMQNDQKIKEKYGYTWSSAHAGREAKNTQVEKYGDHLEIFKKYWKFDYENIFENKERIKKIYKNTLIEKFLLHDYRKGPIKKFFRSI
jgi:hypothetical protein